MNQDQALEMLISGQDVFLTGPAGSGKTYLLLRFIELLKAKGRGVGITASTGIAATHINGRTIHSWAGIEIHERLTDKEIVKIVRREKMRLQFNKTEVLIIDEISMLDAPRLDLVDRVCRAAKDPFRPFGGLQIVFCGDFFQLPPIVRQPQTDVPFAWKARSWQELSPRILYLSEQYRQDDDGFLSALNAIRDQRADAAVRKTIASRLVDVRARGEEITRLFTHNSDVDALNAQALARLPDKEHVFHMKSYGPRELVAGLKKGCLAPETLALKVGAKVMFVKNSYDRQGQALFVNGTMGRILSFDEESAYPIVETLSGRLFVASPEAWAIEENGKVLAELSQVPLRLAWAITVHKSQGMSLDEAVIDLSRCFEYGMGYVALSRLRSLAGLYLIGLSDMAFAIHPEVAAFDRSLQASKN
jgi:ATP-dependent exoDNAse (exonuclease V) alpha subunit